MIVKSLEMKTPKVWCKWIRLKEKKESPKSGAKTAGIAHTAETPFPLNISISLSLCEFVLSKFIPALYFIRLMQSIKN